MGYRFNCYRADRYYYSGEEEAKHTTYHATVQTAIDHIKSEPMDGIIYHVETINKMMEDEVYRMDDNKRKYLESISRKF